MTETLTHDLPQTLRDWAETLHFLGIDFVGDEALCPAAAEIERLEAENERLTADNIMLRTERTVFGKTVDRAIVDGGAKIERLTAEIEQLKMIWGLLLL